MVVVIFLSGNGLKRKQSRKELRKEFRTRKKARVHAYFSSRITKVLYIISYCT